MSKSQRDSLFPKFLVDGMLGSLAIKLRILGADTIYDKHSPDTKLIQISKKEARILITSDRELFLNAKRIHIPAILITKTSERARLVELCHHLGIKKLERPIVSRCSACNSNLVETSESDKFGRQIFECENCEKLYWRGSHWKKLDVFFSEVNRELSSDLSPEQNAVLSAKEQ